MGAAPVLSDQFVLKKCLAESTLTNCTGRKRDNVVVIEVDTDDFGEVIILDVPESFRNKFRKKPRNVISLDDDDDDVAESRNGVCHSINDVTTSNTCSPTQGYRPCTSAYVDEDVNEGNTPVTLSKSKRTYSGKNISRNRYGLSPDSEGCSSDSDCSDCELMEGSLEKLREQWEKASFRKRRDASCVPPDFGNRAGTSGPSHSIYDNAEEGTSEDPEPLGQQSYLRKCSLYDEGDNAFSGSPQTLSQESSEHDHDPMEVDEQSSRTCDNFISSDLIDKAKGGSLTSDCLHHNAEQVLDKISEPVGDYSDLARKFAEQSRFPWQKCDAETQNEVFSRNYPADAPKEASQDVESDHAALFDRQQGAGIPSMPLDLKSSCRHVNESLCSSGENNIITDRQKIKETDEYKHAMEEELAARRQQLLLQADEAQRLRNRKRAEKMRLVMNERRQKERVEEIRQIRRKDEENLNLKEQYRAEVKKELRMIEATCFNMASLLRHLGIHVGGGLYPSPNEVQVAYKRACLNFHPDRISTTDLRQQVEAEEKFKLISNMKDKFLSK